MNNISSLYELIKQKRKELGRPLEIICDWDETLQPVNPYFFYKLSKEKGWELPKETFEECFDYYWENSRIEYKEKDYKNIPYTVYVGIKKIEEIRNEDPDWWSRKGLFNRIVRKPAYEIMNDPNFYEHSPFLSIAEELLMSLKEGLISKLVLVSASNGVKTKNSRKGRKFKKTFAKFPNTELRLEEPGRFTERKEYRWKWIKKDHPDFDIFIDDSPGVIWGAQENLPSDKLFVMPNYKSKISFLPNQDKDNIYYVKTTPSDLKDQDFSIAALELKTKKLEQELKATQVREIIKERQRERERALLNYWDWSSDFAFRDFTITKN